jgi:hypothetical protein
MFWGLISMDIIDAQDFAFQREQIGLLMAVSPPVEPSAPFSISDLPLRALPVPLRCPYKRALCSRDSSPLYMS